MEFQNTNPILKDNFINNNNRKTLMNENIKNLDKEFKKNLPELKLTNLKIRPSTNPETEYYDKNKISNKTGLKYSPLIPKIQKNNALYKKSELMFPKIKKNTSNNVYNEQDRNLIITNFNSNTLHNNSNNYNNYKSSSRRKYIHSTRNAKTKTFYGIYNINKINNLNNNNTNNNINNLNNINSLNQIQNKNRLNNFNEKTNDIEKNNLDHQHHNNNTNYVINLHKIKSKIPKYPRGNKSMPSRIATKIKRYKNDQNDQNVVDHLTIKPLVNYPKNNNYLPSSSNIKLNTNLNSNLNSNINNNINSTNINNSNNSNNPNSLNSLKPTPSSLPTANNFSEYLNILQNLFSSLTSLTGGQNPFYNLDEPKKAVELSPEIFKNTYKNFIPSIKSSPDEFNKNDIIKGYAYNSSMGNIRDYNEDTITATKIILNIKNNIGNTNNNENNSFYFFGIYDGHGGSGCSLYLKNNLHKYIKSFSKESIKEAINEVEKKFLKNEALDEKGELKDQSGSCGIIAMIQKNKCIIANIGDSRLVIYKNNSIFFCTEDHKPGSKIEKERIIKNGGNIYQTPSLFPLYQNGKQIEIPWRVFPGRLSVSRTFGDIEAKNEKFGGNKNVVVALPDINEIELGEEFNLIVLGCDGIFDVLTNEEILQCIKMVLKEKNITKIDDEVNISELCGDFAEMIIKSSLAKDSFDNVSCIVIAINIQDLIN